MYEENLRIIPLGGLGEVGRNMMVLEWGDEAIIVDIGLNFPEEKTPGVDYVIPNISYLEKSKKKILGVILTHGHYDHIGAIPYILDKIGNPPLFGSAMTLGITTKRQEEFPLKPKLRTNEIKEGDRIELGPFTAEFFHQNHNVPDGHGVLIETPVGNIIHTSDFKFDLTPTNAPPTDFDRLHEIASRGILLLMSDSTGAEAEGRSLSEKVISENLDIIFEKAKGRIITATFASLINRIQDIITLSEKRGRKVVVEGYGMKTNIEIARNLGLIKTKKGTVIPAEKASDYPDNKITILSTGAQGEGNAALMRILSKQHRHFQLRKGDSVVLSSSVIPGNERAVQNLKDDIMRQGAYIFHSQMMDIHAKGHAQQEELRDMIRIMSPQFFLPIHGQYSMMASHAQIAHEEGVPKSNIALIDNGFIITINKEKLTISKKPVPVAPVMVDGSGIGDVGGVVLHDRMELAESGIFVVIAVIDKKTRKIKNSPDIISRGFVYLRESQLLLTEVRKKVMEIISRGGKQQKDVKDIKPEIKSKIEGFLYSKTGRRPMVLPVVIEV
jgi:ribonuclease J